MPTTQQATLTTTQLPSSTTTQPQQQKKQYVSRVWYDEQEKRHEDKKEYTPIEYKQEGNQYKKIEYNLGTRGYKGQKITEPYAAKITTYYDDGSIKREDKFRYKTTNSGKAKILLTHRIDYQEGRKISRDFSRSSVPLSSPQPPQKTTEQLKKELIKQRSSHLAELDRQDKTQQRKEKEYKEGMIKAYERELEEGFFKGNLPKELRGNTQPKPIKKEEPKKISTKDYDIQKASKDYFSENKQSSPKETTSTKEIEIKTVQPKVLMGPFPKDQKFITRKFLKREPGGNVRIVGDNPLTATAQYETLTLPIEEAAKRLTEDSYGTKRYYVRDGKLYSRSQDQTTGFHLPFTREIRLIADIQKQYRKTISKKAHPDEHIQSHIASAITGASGLIYSPEFITLPTSGGSALLKTKTGTKVIPRITAYGTETIKPTEIVNTIEGGKLLIKTLRNTAKKLSPKDPIDLIWKDHIRQLTTNSEVRQEFLDEFEKDPSKMIGEYTPIIWHVTRSGYNKAKQKLTKSEYEAHSYDLKEVPKEYRTMYKDLYNIMKYSRTKLTIDPSIDFSKTKYIDDKTSTILKKTTIKNKDIIGGSLPILKLGKFKRTPRDIDIYSERPKISLNEYSKELTSKGIKHYAKDNAIFINNKKVLEINNLELMKSNIKDVIPRNKNWKEYIIKGSDNVNYIDPKILFQRKLLGAFQPTSGDPMWRFPKDAPAFAQVSESILKSKLASARSPTTKYKIGRKLDYLNAYKKLLKAEQIQPELLKSVKRPSLLTAGVKYIEIPKIGKRGEIFFHGAPKRAIKGIEEKGILTGEKLGIKKNIGNKRLLNKDGWDVIFLTKDRKLAKLYSGKDGKVYEIDLSKKELKTLKAEWYGKTNTLTIKGNIPKSKIQNLKKLGKIREIKKTPYTKRRTYKPNKNTKKRDTKYKIPRYKSKISKQTKYKPYTKQKQYEISQTKPYKPSYTKPYEQKYDKPYIPPYDPINPTYKKPQYKPPLTTTIPPYGITYKEPQIKPPIIIKKTYPKKEQKIPKIIETKRKHLSGYTPLYHTLLGMLKGQTYKTKKQAISTAMKHTDQSPTSHFSITKNIKTNTLAKGKTYNKPYKFRKKGKTYIEKRYYRFDTPQERRKFDVSPYVFRH